MKCVQIPSNLKKMNQFFENAGFKAYLVGGAVRDMLLGQKVSDFDLATNATPQQVMSIFKKVIPTGIEHVTVTVLFMGMAIEVTTFRIEQGYSDSRHPDKISFTDDITEDLSRRDFTINAIAASLLDGKIIDPFDGQKDLKNKIIRTVGSATERFSEDGLRPIRAIRFASKLNFKIEEETLKAIPLALEKTKTISIERFRDEFCKMLVSEKPSVGLKLMEETGILEFFLPELASCRNITQADFRGIHNFDILDHLFYACDGAPKEKLLVRISALFHDIGKPQTRKEDFKTDNLTIIKDMFDHKTFDLSDYDFVIAQEPCDATEHVLLACKAQNKPFFMSLCGVPHKKLSGEMPANYSDWYAYLLNESDGYAKLIWLSLDPLSRTAILKSKTGF